MNCIQQWFRSWYQGRFISPEDDPEGRFIHMGGRYERHLSSRFAHTFVDFYVKEWKWFLMFLIALVAATMNYFK